MTGAFADFVGSAAAVAVMVTVCFAVMVPGGVYRPEEDSAPTAGDSDHVTALFVLPVTLAVNCWVSPAPRLMLDGLTATDMGGTEDTAGIKVIAALPVFDESATEAAVIVTVC